MESENKKSSRVLPDDNLECILPRLPVKSLLRFKAISRSWSNLISSAPFIQNHLRLSKNFYSQNLFIGNSSVTLDSLGRSFLGKFSLHRLENREFRMEAELEAPEGSRAVLCCCDGVLLLRGRTSQKYIMWNPSIRTSKEFTFPYDKFEERNYGLCHNTTGSKILILSWHHFAVGSCRNGSWTRKIGYGNTSGISKDPGIFVDGAVYWVWTKGLDKYLENDFNDDHQPEIPQRDIIYFDPIDDELKILHKPQELKNQDQIFLISIRNRLCVSFHDIGKSIVNIWMKDEGAAASSWTHFMKIEHVPLHQPGLFKPLYFQEHKLVIRQSEKGSRFLEYNTSGKFFEEFQDASIVNTKLVPYVDSFLFFNVAQPQ